MRYQRSWHVLGQMWVRTINNNIFSFMLERSVINFTRWFRWIWMHINYCNQLKIHLGKFRNVSSLWLERGKGRHKWKSPCRLFVPRMLFKRAQAVYLKLEFNDFALFFWALKKIIIFKLTLSQNVTRTSGNSFQIKFLLAFYAKIWW